MEFPMGIVNSREGRWAWATFVSMRASSRSYHCSKRYERAVVSWRPITTKIAKKVMIKPCSLLQRGLTGDPASGHWHIEIINIQSMKTTSSPSQGRKHLPFYLSLSLKFEEVTLVNKIVYNSERHHLYIILYVYYHKSSFLQSLFPPFPSSTSPHPLCPFLF